MKQSWTGNKNKKFNLNFFLVGNSGSGKTHLAGTYSLGPTHFYMFDKGGENTLDKLIQKKTSKLSLDLLSSDDLSFSDIWTSLQKDQRDGFFDQMAEENGLIVFDSLTSVNQKAIKEIMYLNKRTGNKIGKPGDDKKNMRIQDWGQLLQWMTQFVGIIQELPCATITTVHLHTLTDKDNAVVARYPSVNGQFRQIVGVNYDETYLLEVRGENHILHFKERFKFEAKSRVFASKEVRNYTMDDLANAYMKGITDLPKKK